MPLKLPDTFIFVLFAMLCVSQLAWAQEGLCVERRALRGTAQVKADTNILILLDCSFSMKDKLGDGQPKIIEAKRVLESALDSIPPDVNIGFRIFGQTRARNYLSDCQQCELLVPLGTGNRGSIINEARWLAPSGATPLTLALMQAEHDLRETRGAKTIILISDGAETCCGDPCEFIARLRALGEPITVQVIGLDLKRDHRAREQLNCIGEQSGGKYYDANTSAQLFDGMSHIVMDAVSGQLMTKSQRLTMNTKVAPEVSVAALESESTKSAGANADNDSSSLSINGSASASVPASTPASISASDAVRPTDETIHQDTSKQKLESYALEFVNQERRRHGLDPLQWDDVAYRVAASQVDDLCRRDTVSYFNKLDEGPDLRYTKAGGNDDLVESLDSVTGVAAQDLNRGLVVQAIKQMLARQDDRDSLLSPYATHFAFSFRVPPAKSKAIVCAEVVRKHGAIDPIPLTVKVGDDVDVKGQISPPYQFSNVSVAWEGGALEAPMSDDDKHSHATSYFPPFDYMCYAKHAKHDPSLLLERVVNITPVFVWIPSLPVPVRGGIKIEGSSFEGRIPINHENQQGYYYLTIWATLGDHGSPVAISRRVIVATAPDSVQPSAKNSGHGRK